MEESSFAQHEKKIMSLLDQMNHHGHAVAQRANPKAAAAWEEMKNSFPEELGNGHGIRCDPDDDDADCKPSHHKRNHLPKKKVEDAEKMNLDSLAKLHDKEKQLIEAEEDIAKA